MNPDRLTPQTTVAARRHADAWGEAIEVMLVVVLIALLDLTGWSAVAFAGAWCLAHVLSPFLANAIDRRAYARKVRRGRA